MDAALRNDIAPRIHFDQPVTLVMPDEQPALRGRALNLSRAGIFIELEQPHLQPQGRVEVHFTLPDGAAIQAEAWAVRDICAEDPVEPQGLALCFTRIGAACSVALDEFLAQRLRTAAGETVRLQLDELGASVRARAHSSWSNVLSVDAELPFLRVGSPVTVPLGGEQSSSARGCIRWVSVHVGASSGVPRLNIGIELEPQGDAEGELCAVWEAWEDEGDDPVCTPEFAEQARVLSGHLREQRRVAVAGRRV